MTYADVKNKSGNYIEPTAESATAAGDGITVPDNLVFSALDSPAPDAYPITAQSWVIVYAKQPAGQVALQKAYIDYLVGDGQKLLTDIDYAPLPKSIQDKAIAQLDKITG